MSKERKDKHFLHKPEYVGGSSAIKKFVTEHIQYPEAAAKAQVEGTVHLRYDINHKGVVTGAKIISGIGYGCDEEAIRLVKMLKFQLAKNRGVKAVFHKNIKIHFRKPKVAKREATPSPTKSLNINYNYISKPKEPEETAAEKSKNKNASYNYNINF